jgi:uncharacterized protein (UPF0212 family)
MVWKCRKCGRILTDPDEDIDHEDFHETILCPKCDEPLEAVYLMGDKHFIDLLICPKCGVAYDPTSLKPLAHII